MNGEASALLKTSFSILDRPPAYARPTLSAMASRVSTLGPPATTGGTSLSRESESLRSSLLRPMSPTLFPPPGPFVTAHAPARHGGSGKQPFSGTAPRPCALPDDRGRSSQSPRIGGPTRQSGPTGGGVWLPAGSVHGLYPLLWRH
jgi:hypothetical protein